MSVSHILGECYEEFRLRQQRSTEKATYYASSKPLIERLGKQAEPKQAEQPQARPKKKKRCAHCGKTNHKVQDCYHLAKPKCSFCNRLGHDEKECRTKKKQSRPQNKEQLVAAALAPKQQSNITENEGDDELEEVWTAMNTEENMYDHSDSVGDDDLYLAQLAANENARMYDWLADSGSTNHITNRRELFTTYEATPDATVYGVGGKNINVVGRGTIHLTAQYGTRTRTLRLDGVNFIPSNKYNILALGRWDTQGRRYQASDGTLTLYDRKNVPILSGNKVASHLYKFRLLPANDDKITNSSDYAFTCHENLQTWETWHRRFGHVSYDGLKKLHSKHLLLGFTVDPKTPTPDCIACTQAKQTRKPFDAKSEKPRGNKGELTHMDLWGKYNRTSINGNQYYLLLVDDATRYVTVYFLKGKHEVMQYVKEYLTHLHVRGISTHAIRADRGTEFVNRDLQRWCHEKGMEVQLTAPYSPSQNGVAERMNRTLVELARAMIVGSNLPEFLWENAVAHAAYIRNRSYTTAISEKTPYEGWNREKPNIAHLREFGAPVWILLQGQNVARKILSKSKRRAYVGNNDASNSVLYYNADTRKVLTSRNYVFLTERKPEPPEAIIRNSTPQHEGEREDGTARGVETTEPNASRKRKEPPDQDEPRQTRGIRRDY
jgi:hypothetical protein